MGGSRTYEGSSAQGHPLQLLVSGGCVLWQRLGAEMLFSFQSMAGAAAWKLGRTLCPELRQRLWVRFRAASRLGSRAWSWSAQDRLHPFAPELAAVCDELKGA
jgi:hypothetical protein